MGYDPELGQKIHEHLSLLDIETPAAFGSISASERTDVSISMSRIMFTLGMKMQDESLKDTPTRVSKMYCDEIFYGLDYDKFPSCSTFPSSSDEMVAVRGIEVKSMCEHHFLPFIGTATVGYIPAGRVIGISKLNRIVDFFSRRPQMQERLTEQIAAAVGLVLSTEDVAVYICSKHFCTQMRGVKDFSSETVTSKLMGRFRSVTELRSEFLTLTK